MKKPFGKKNKETEKHLTADDRAGKRGVVVRDSDPLKRPGRMKERETYKEDAYYVRLSDGMRVFRYIVTVILLVFAVGMAFLYRSEITAENFGLLFRNASFSFPGEKKAFDTVRYDADLEMDFALYKEYFAVAATTSMRMYDYRGNVVLQEDCRMKDPTFCCGKNYLMVYDKEGKNYFICNSVAVLKEDETERTIYDADMSDQGSYLLVSSSGQHLSVISVYNRSFNLRATLSFDRYPQKALLSEDGDRLLFLSYGTNDAGAIEGHVGFFDLSGQTTEKTADHVYDSVPLACVLNGRGAAVLFADRVIFYDPNGAERSTFDMTGRTPRAFALSDAHLALLFKGNDVLAENSVTVFDAETGRTVRSLSFTGRVKGLWMKNGTLFIGENETLHLIDPESGRERPYACPLPADVIFAEDALFLCYTNKAENIYTMLDFEKDGSS